jgi:hypothetical protein
VRRSLLLGAAYVVLTLFAGAEAQAQPVTQSPAVSAAAEKILLTAGRSTVLRTDFDVILPRSRTP